ncbi:diguanylate cyclase [Salmonella enterica subsp. enterica serovar Heidelberg str. CFSAN002075]|nr:diguanylate cyclase [Salmonella enterica subsp. enterica serovar Heidelberg str. CFSAN002075]
MQQPDGSWELRDGVVERIESCGLMVAVGYWVLEESCRQLAAWQEHGVGAAGIVKPLSYSTRYADS